MKRKLLTVVITIFAFATLAPAQSSQVAIIGGSTLDYSIPCAMGYGSPEANVMGATAGGCLALRNFGPLTGFSAFTFAAIPPAAVNAATLAPFDTAVLNMASTAINCSSVNLSPQAQLELVAFVANGKKLIIFDSECRPIDYSWLPFPFVTSNPGAMGAPGTLTIVEENTLSSNDPSNPKFIDAAHLGGSTDAVGDMNVMTTMDPNWCVDMSGTNYLKVTGPVHTYAKYPSDSDSGLIIYNGLDQDYESMPDAMLAKVWLQELQQPFNPSMLPCGFTVVGITLTPVSAVNTAGTDHTVTAQLADLLGNPKPGVAVSLEFESGPNVGATWTCTPNADCTTDAAGTVNFTYTGAMAVGTDKIVACFLNTAGKKVCSQPVTKEWTDGTAPVISCGSDGVLWPPNHKLVPIKNDVTASDQESGIASVVLLSVTSNEPDNGLGDGDTAMDIQGFQVMTSDFEGYLRAERGGNGTGRVYTLIYQATNGANLSTTCTTKYVVPHDMK